MDLSESMVDAARKNVADSGCPGEVLHGDIFSLPSLLKEVPDLVASVRFLYYFQREKRLELLRQMRSVCGTGLLVQYKTTDTLRGRRTFARGQRRSKTAPYYATVEEIREELAECGLKDIRVRPIGQLSDRVYASGLKA